MKTARRICWILLPLVLACAGSLPSVPNAPGDILAKGDAYYVRGKYFQSAELYKAFVERYPGNDRSDYAQFRLAESYFHDGQYELAAVEYRVVMSQYGYSEYVDDALFQLAVCSWRRAPSVARDQQLAKDALSKFEQFIQTFPRNKKVADAREYIRKIHARLARKAMAAVHWYYRRHKDRAVRIYCDKIIADYPDNPFWAEALYYKGLIALRAGNRVEASRYFSRVLTYPGVASAKSLAQARLKETRN